MNEALKHLSKDPVLKKVIEKYGPLEIKKREVNLFEDIIDSIISQQLSLKAAATIFTRFKNLFGDSFPTPTEILKVPDEKIRECGISFSKIKYIKGVCEAVIAGQLKLKDFNNLSDEEAKSELVKLKGIGEWTAEMILMFSLYRKDVFSLGDMGLKNAMSALYKIDKTDIDSMKKISDKWSPERTLAARYLWKSLDNE